MKQRGFTLIEMVIVIAILGILAGIAIPRYMNMREEALGAKIIADLETIESAANMYATKHGAYPYRINTGDGNGSFASQLVPDYLAYWPGVPAPQNSYFKVIGNDGTQYRYKIVRANVLYAWNGPVYDKPSDAHSDRATIGRWTTSDFKNGKQETVNTSMIKRDTN